MSHTRLSYSRLFKVGLVCSLASLVVAGDWVFAASKRRTTRTTTSRRRVVRTMPSATIPRAAVNPNAPVRTVRLHLVVSAGNGARVTLDIDQGVGRLMNHSEKMFESDIFLTAGRTYTFTYHYEDLESNTPYRTSRTWLERDGNFLYDFAHTRRKPGGRMTVYKRSVYIP